MKSVCHFVPALAFALALPISGCYGIHGTGEPGRCPITPGMVCCARGAPLPVGESECPFRCPPGSALIPSFECEPSSYDGGTPPSPPPPRDGGRLLCPEARADATCLRSFFAPAATPFELPVAFEGCACCADAECRAEPDFATQTLRLTTTLCPDPCDCDACNIPTALCEVPALPEGDWDVVVNGSHAFTLPVLFDSGLVPLPPACATFASPDFCAFDEEITLIPSRPSTICVGPSSPYGNREMNIQMSFECPSCGELNGTCVVIAEPRYTDDLPPGGELRIISTLHVTDCDVDCPPECSLRVQDCWVPPLVEGEFYRVWLGDSIVSSFTVGGGAVACTFIDGIPPG